MSDQAAQEDGVKDSWARGWAALNELLVHTIVIIFVVACIEAIEVFIKHTKGDKFAFFEESPFSFPAQWLLDAGDVAMIGALLTLGVRATYRVYRGKTRK